MRKVILFCALLPVIAWAAPASLSFTRPTARVDGSPLSVSEIASYNLACSYTPTGGVAAACAALSPVSLPGASLGGAVTFNVSQSGQACFTLQTVDTGGRTSAVTNQACKDIVISPPNPPTNVTVAVNIAILQVPVYSVTAANARSVYMGMIDLGKPCTGAVLFSYRQKQFREVARSDVHLWGSTTLRLAAPCA